MSTTPKRMIRLACLLLLISAAAARGQNTLTKTTLQLEAGDVEQLTLKQGNPPAVRWTSADPKIAAVYGKGYVCGIHPGTANISAGEAACAVTVVEPSEPIVTAASFKQYPDNRKFTVKGRKCYGSELNGQRNSDPKERANTESNRVINPHPVSNKNLEWELRDGAEAYDGAGVLMGTVAPKRTTSGKQAPLSMFNFGMSKVLHDKICVYGFAVTIEPSPAVQKVADAPTRKSGNMSTSAWIPLEQVVAVDELLDRIGLGKVQLPRMPLEPASHIITGGDPQSYMTESGELAIVKALDGPVPSHYLRRPTGTVNLIYSVPGYGLGGQSLDSFLVSDGAVFHQAKGAKVFVQPTYYPKGHPKAGKVSPKKMTFLYGAVEVKGSPPVFGWIAKEALSPAKP
jgi:hypothetical protein